MPAGSDPEVVADRCWLLGATAIGEAGSSLEVGFETGEDADAAAAALRPLGEPVPARPGCLAVRLPGGATALPAAVRALDDAGVEVAGLDLAVPTLDDVFVAKTGRRLEAESAGGPAGAPAPSAA